MIKGGMGYRLALAFGRCRFARSRTTYPEKIQFKQYFILPRGRGAVASHNTGNALLNTATMAPKREALLSNPCFRLFRAEPDHA